MTQAAAQLQSRYDELQAHQSKASSIQAPVSGLFSSYVDGYETVLTPAKLEGLGPRDLEAFAQTDPTPADNVIGKLVTNAAWYYAITVPGIPSAGLTTATAWTCFSTPCPRASP